jgi:hypothetical protein
VGESERCTDSARVLANVRILFTLLQVSVTQVSMR